MVTQRITVQLTFSRPKNRQKRKAEFGKICNKIGYKTYEQRAHQHAHVHNSSAYRFAPTLSHLADSV